jgi:nucleoside-diphosphate-sugar epimerase
MKVALITGAAGFIGSALTERLLATGWQVRAIGRGAGAYAGGIGIECGDLGAADSHQLDDWLHGVDVVFHLAGRAHRRDAGSELERYARYRRDNVSTTQALFLAAQRNAVQRFVFLSSIKVLGDYGSQPFVENAEPDPQDVYAQTKLEAERQLEDTLSRADTQVSIVRPPLVYGPGVKGNFRSLLSAVARGWPLPLGRADAPRSLLARANLVELLIAAAGDTADLRILHARDDADSSVAQLVTMIARAFGRSPRLIAVPRRMMCVSARTTGLIGLYQRLFEPCAVDDSVTRAALGWQPTVPQQHAIDEVAAWWRTQR